ncbi:MAG: PepSY domain-containing protein [Hyphomonadaceae bacterium]
MRLAAAASAVHKWLALVIGVQILFWVASGLFFAIYPIERVRSEHRIAESAAAPLARIPADIAPLLSATPTRLSYERDATGREVAVAEFDGAPPALIELESMRVLSPLDERAAMDIARAHVAGAPVVREVQLIERESPQYRGALPAWRVAFDDGEGLAVYVAANTGRVTARRSDLWRVYDALWALHIMDWRDHENFNTGLLIFTSFMALIVIAAGFILFPYRLRFGRRSFTADS